MARTNALIRYWLASSEEEECPWVKDGVCDEDASFCSIDVEVGSEVGGTQYVVDLQGFQRSPKEIVYKEVAIIALSDTAVPSVYCFKPPVSWLDLLPEERSSARWLENNHHGIPWGSGEIPYDQMEDILKKNLFFADKIYVKGQEKKNFLKKILPHIFICDMEDLRCPSLRQLRCTEIVYCTNHKLRRWDSTCAIRNACALRTWLTETRNASRNRGSQRNLEGEDELDCGGGGHGSQPSVTSQGYAQCRPVEDYYNLYA